MSYNNPTSLAGTRTPGKQPRYKTYSEISFPTLSLETNRPRVAELYQSWNQHDILIVKFSETSPKWFSLLETGVPVTFTWVQDNRKKVWYGYVSHVTKDVLAQKRREMQVRCVGSSFPLKERATRVFIDSTIPEAVKTIVEEHGFHFIGDTDSRKFPQLSMAGHSYWEWIQEQAKRIGFAVVVDGTDFYFREQDSFVDQNIGELPVLSLETDLPAFGNQFADRTLDYLHVMKGEHIETGESLHTKKTVGGVDPVTMVPFVKTVSPDGLGDNLRKDVNAAIFSEFRTDQVVNAEVDASSVAGGAAKLSRFTLPATAKGQGDPRLRPHAPVLIKGTGGESDGYWVVKEVKHYIQFGGEYTVDLLLLSDGMGENQQTNLRQSSPTKVSTINIQEALARAKKTGSANGTSTPHLTTRSPLLTESKQGFTRTPSTWLARKTSKG